MLKRTLLLISIIFSIGISNLQAAIEIHPHAPMVLQAGSPVPVAILLQNSGKSTQSGKLVFSCRNGKVTPAEVSYSMQPGGQKIVVPQVSLNSNFSSGQLTCKTGSVSTTTAIIPGIDLCDIPWKRKLVPVSIPHDLKLASESVDDSNWPEIRPPLLWNENDNSWCRIRVTIPEQWRSHKVRLVVGAIDDNDITYLNGEEIGRTTGWDLRREYVLPDNLIHWGKENLITIMVENFNAGGGLYKAPIMLLAGDNPPAVSAGKYGIRPKQGKIGNPLPLRPMHVDKGVLRYPDKTEVALWGTNIYPQSWYEFENLKTLKVDYEATIRQDLDHLQLMGIEAIRIHVFAGEITDAKGNIFPNIHLNLLDYIVSECSRRGIYMFFTPIAWWGSPNNLEGNFTSATTKPGMMFVPDAKNAAVNYLKQFLTHKNRYSGRLYKDEPSLCLLEVMNEPAYFDYGDIYTSTYNPQGEPDALLDRDHSIFRSLWKTWLSENKLDERPVYFRLFRYQLMRSYINQMIQAIRSTGAKQPIAISSIGAEPDELTQAIADSDCEAVTYGSYPGGWVDNDLNNQLPGIGPMKVDPRFSAKARLVYEFDAPGMTKGCYLYPAMAAMFRSGEVQVACQFQYDSIATARYNTDWDVHWLNWIYTPWKTVSFMVAREAFHRLPRGVQFQAGKTDLHIGPMATSFDHNISMVITPDTVMYSNPITDWQPIPLPKNPGSIVGVGSSPYVGYDGNGIYTISPKGKDTFILSINPDIKVLQGSRHGSFSSPVAELEMSEHLFTIKLQGWENAKCVSLEDTKPEQITRSGTGWMLKPGKYKLIKQVISR